MDNYTPDKRKNDHWPEYNLAGIYPPRKQKTNNNQWGCMVVTCGCFPFVSAIAIAAFVLLGGGRFLDDDGDATLTAIAQIDAEMTLTARSFTATPSPTKRPTITPTASVTATPAVILQPPTTTPTPTPFAATFNPRFTEVPITNRVIQLEWSSDGRTVIAASPFGIWLFDSWNPGLPPEPLSIGTRTQQRLISAMTLSDDGEHLAVADSGGGITIWHIPTRELVSSWEAQLAIYQMDFKPDGSQLATSSESGAVLIWDVPAGDVARVLEGQPPIISVAYSPSGQQLATGRVNGTVQVLDLSTGPIARDLDTSHFGWVVSVAFAPDGSAVASLGEGGPLFVTDRATGQRRATLSGRGNALAFDPTNSGILASADKDGFVRIWRIDNANATAELPFPGEANAVVFRHDGAVVAGGGQDGVIRLWQVASGAQQIEWRLPGP